MPSLNKKFFVFTYHSVAPDSSKPFVSIPWFDIRVKSEIFEKHLQYYLKNFCLIGEKELISNVFPVSNKPYGILTFDDGYVDNYSYAFPLLCKYKVPAIFFPVVDAIEKNAILWDNLFLEITYQLNTDQLKEFFSSKIKDIENIHSKEQCIKHIADFIKYKINSQAERISWVKQLSEFSNFKLQERQRYLTIPQCLEMQKSGLVTFGSHTLSHCILNHSHEFENEICLSKKLLEDKLDKPIHSICYPSGGYNQSVTKVCANTGYKMGFTVEPGFNSLTLLNNFEIKRFHIGNINKYHLIFELSGWKHKISEKFKGKS
ncbi:MAG: hypothetical protein A3H98_03280 [Bacteroidetes bacterium RIFCSPLOWO2_02_FULL_36_8]|nr:MAG: hypothetical protein A3H98_03280 [Bacteroidetes bacterium RIFCSPLOWO2_02_FULL_36_8]OFY71373.1 MAG: hypothetical protein A3G23_04265 [Bacteroidetes bacterium RIFCSPLOWO2_12_FULL_37_12]